MQGYCDVCKWTILKRTWPEVKCIHPTSSTREMCMSSVRNVIYHKFSHGATYDVTFLMGMACEFTRRPFGWKILVIRLLYRAFKEKMKIQGRYPLKLGFVFTTTWIMIVHENVMKSGTN